MRSAVARPSQMIGLTLEEGKHLLAALQVHLVQAQAKDHSRRGRRCPRCGSQRPLKDQRARRLVSLFGTVEGVPRFTPCRCATRLEQEAVAGAGSRPPAATKSFALSVDGGHVRAARQYQGRSFEALLAQVSNDEGKRVVFASVPAEATSQTRQLRGVLHGLGATPATPVTILSDGAD
jgi:hypothetical protein